MSTEIRQLEPRAVWNKFADLNAVPRPSKKEERVIAFMKDFGASLSLEVIEDSVGNVIIKKPATVGMEDRKPIVMQSHLDMVHQKNNETIFDFLTEGIEMHVEGDWVKAKGTTLGADNGLGVATIMAVLGSNDISHPAIEALFTIDEETGMTGAMGLKGGLLSGTILLNLDTEEDDEIGVGCAGGIDVTAQRDYNEESTPETKIGYEIEVNGLHELLGLGLIDKVDVQNEDPKWPAYKKYFMHGTSHHMGLDTHDFGALKSPMQANMVFTVEPGIYIPEENMGIRLEDDVVIQAKGSPVNLMQNIPIEIDEIEALMNSN